MDVRALMDIRRYLAIRHHVPGRIRIGFGVQLLADPRARAVMDRVRDGTPSPCIRATRLNLIARNVVIEYDPDALEPELLHEALTTSDQDRLNELAAELEAVLSG